MPPSPRALLALCAAATATAASGAAALAPTYTLMSNVTHMAGPAAVANVSWAGIAPAAAGDWITVACVPGDAYYW